MPQGLTPVRMVVQFLKDESPPKLHLPGVANKSCKLSGANGVHGASSNGGRSGCRSGVVLDVEYVEGFKAKLQALTFAQGDILRQGQIRVCRMRASQAIA